MNLPLISVVITCFNYGSSLNTAIESCLAQDYPNIEILIVDDCSTDNTQLVSENFSRLYPTKIKYLKTPNNLGANGAWNFGMDHAKGVFVCGLDADDVFPADSISSRVTAIQKLNCDFVGTSIYLYRSNNSMILPSVLFTDKNKLKSFLKDSKQKETMGINVCTFLWRRVALVTIGFRDTEKWLRSADYELGLRSIYKLNGIVLDKPTYEYHTHDNSQLSQARGIDKEMKIIKDLEDWYLRLLH